MRILFDEWVPRGLKRRLHGFQFVLTVPEAGFAGLSNGRLLRTIVGQFDVFITVDKSIQFQQDLSQYRLSFVLLRSISNDIADIQPLVPKLLDRLAEVAPGKLLIIE